jgi:hypothetical protein
MPQLDFRQAFVSSDHDSDIVVQPQALPHNDFADEAPKIVPGRFGTTLGRSDWTNISFVTMATLGGFVCAFYFFNGGDVLRAAAAWPREFLYPRPVASVAKTQTLAQQTVSDQAPTQPDRAARSAQKSSGPFGRDYLGDSFSAPSPPSGIASNSNAGTGFSSTVGSTLSQLSSLPRGADALFQSLYQTVIAPSQVKSVASTTRRAVVSTRKKIAAAKQTAATQTSSTTNSASQVSQQAANSVRSVVGPGGGIPGLGGPGGGGIGGAGGLGGIGGGGVSLGGGLGVGGGGR